MFAAFIFGAAGLAAAPLQRDLGDGLIYFRLHALPADIPDDAAVQKHSTIIDLRYVKTDANGASVFGSWLKFHAQAHHPIFVLVNGATAPALVGMLSDQTGVEGLLTIGSMAQKSEPDIAVTIPADTEKRAYEALEAGGTVTALTTDNPDKQRNDEASLAHDRTPDTAADTDSLLEVEKPAGAPKPRPLIDAALQRALQVYRGLKAMKAVG